MNQVVLLESWQNVCHHIQNDQQVDWIQFSSVKDKLVPQAMSDGFLLLTIDSKFLRTWTIKNFLGAIKRALFEIYGKNYEVQIELDEGDDEEITPLAAQTQNFQPASAQAPIVQINTPQIQTNVENSDLPQDFLEQEVPTTIQVTKEVSLIPTLTFQNFVLGESNRFAYSMAIQVAETPGSSALNPLFIYGRSGVGKTHLLRAIQNDLIKTHPGFDVIYIDTNELVNDYTRAAAEHEREKNSFYNFREKYENADVLLIDDIQFLQGKKQTLDNVFQILNNLIANGKQIVLSADRAPRVIDIDERYTSRFLQGYTCEINPPEFETKKGIIERFVNEYNSQSLKNIEIPEDIVNFIAENSSSNIRELKGAVTKILYETSFNPGTLNKEDIKHTLLNHFTSLKTNIGVEDITKVVEDYYKISHAEMIGKSRSKNIAYARQIDLYLCRTILDIPFMELGAKFNRDHSTVMYAVNTIEQKLLKDRNTEEEIEVLKNIIKDL